MFNNYRRYTFASLFAVFCFTSLVAGPAILEAAQRKKHVNTQAEEKANYKRRLKKICEKERAKWIKKLKDRQSKQAFVDDHEIDMDETIDDFKYSWPK